MQSGKHLRFASPFLVLVLTVFLGACHSAPPKEKTDIDFTFQGIEVSSLVDDVYRPLANWNVTPPASGWPNVSIHLVTDHAVTKQEALQLIEDALKKQAHVVIHHGADGSLSAARE